MPGRENSGYSSKLHQQAESKVGDGNVTAFLSRCKKLSDSSKCFYHPQAECSYSYWAAGQCQSTTFFQEKVSGSRNSSLSFLLYLLHGVGRSKRSHLAEIGSQRAWGAGQARAGSNCSGYLCLEPGVPLAYRVESWHVACLTVTLNVHKGFLCCPASLRCCLNPCIFSMAYPKLQW